MKRSLKTLLLLLSAGVYAATSWAETCLRFDFSRAGKTTNGNDMSVTVTEGATAQAAFDWTADLTESTGNAKRYSNSTESNFFNAVTGSFSPVSSGYPMVRCKFTNDSGYYWEMWIPVTLTSNVTFNEILPEIYAANASAGAQIDVKKFEFSLSVYEGQQTIGTTAERITLLTGDTDSVNGTNYNTARISSESSVALTAGTYTFVLHLDDKACGGGSFSGIKSLQFYRQETSTRALATSEESWSDQEWGESGTAAAPTTGKVTLTSNVEGGTRLLMDTSVTLDSLTTSGSQPLTIATDGTNKLAALTTTINADTTVEAGAASLGAVTIASGKTLKVNDQALTSAAGGGTLVKVGEETLTLQGDVSDVVSTYEVNEGKLIISNRTSRSGGLQYNGGTPSYKVAGGAHLVWDSNDLVGWQRKNTVPVAEISGILEKTHEANETFSGHLLLKNGGELKNSAGADKFRLFNSAIIEVGEGATATATITGNGIFVDNGKPEFKVNQGATLNVSAKVDLDSDATLKKTGSGTWNQEGVISGNGGLTVSSGTLTLKAANKDYEKTITVESDAILRLNAPAFNASNDTTVANTCTLKEGATITTKPNATVYLTSGGGYFGIDGNGTVIVDGGSNILFGLGGTVGNTISANIEVPREKEFHVRAWNGAATISGGNITVNGSIVADGGTSGALKIEIANGKTLSGTGTIGGALILANGAIIDATTSGVTANTLNELPANLTVKIANALEVGAPLDILTTTATPNTEATKVTVMVGDGDTPAEGVYSLVATGSALQLRREEDSLMGTIFVKGSNASLTTKLTSGQMGDGEQWGVQIDMDAAKPYGPGWQTTQALKTFSVVRAKNDVSQDWTNTTVSIVDVDTPRTVLATSTVGVEETDYTLTYSDGSLEERKLLTFTFATAVDLDKSKTYQFRFNEERNIRMMHIQSIEEDAKNTSAINVLNSNFVVEKATEYTPIVELGVEIPALVINASAVPVDVAEVPTTLALDTASFMGGYGTTYTVLNYTGDGEANWKDMTYYGLPEGAEVVTTDTTWGFTMTMIRVLPIGDSITAGLVKYYNSSANWHVAGGYRLPLYQYMTQAYGEGKVKYLGTSTYSTSVTGDNSLNSYEDRDIDSVTLTEASQLNHEGHSGATLDGANCQIYDRFKNQKVIDIIAEQGTPDVITLHLGTNDFGLQNPADSAEGAFAEMKQLLYLLNGACDSSATDEWKASVGTPLYPNATIFVAKIIPRADSGLMTNQIDPFNNLLATYVTSLASDKLVLVDLGMANNYGLLRHDGLHPSTEGYSRMAQNWFANIEAVLPPMGAEASIATVDARVANTLKVTTNKAIDTSLTQTWTLDKDATVSAATITDDKRTVILTVEGVVANTEYILTATNLFAADDSVTKSFTTTADIHTPTTDVVESDRAGSVSLVGVLKAAEWTTFEGFVSGFTSPIGYMPESGRPWQLDVRGDNTPTVENGVLSLNGAPLTVNFKDGHIGTTKSVRTTVMEVSNLSAGDVLFTETGNNNELNKITIVDGDTLTWNSGSVETVELASYGIDLIDDIPEVITETFAAIPDDGYNCKLTVNGIEVATSNWVSSGEWVNGYWTIGANSTATTGSSTMKLYRLSFYEGEATVVMPGTTASINVGEGAGQYITWTAAKKALGLKDAMTSVTINFTADDQDFTFDEAVTIGALTVQGEAGRIAKTGAGKVTVVNTDVKTSVVIDGLALGAVTVAENQTLMVTKATTWSSVSGLLLYPATAEEITAANGYTNVFLGHNSADPGDKSNWFVKYDETTWKASTAQSDEAPLVGGKDGDEPWAPALFDGNLIEQPAAVDGKTTITASQLEGWEMKFAVKHNVNLEVEGLVKIQSDGWIDIDETSKVTIKKWATGNSHNGSPTFKVKSSNGLVFDLTEGNPTGYNISGTTTYELDKNGSVSYQAITSGTHCVDSFVLDLNATDDNDDGLITRTLVSFTRCTPSFTLTPTSVTCVGEEGVTATKVNALADLDEVGEYYLAQDDTTVTVTYVLPKELVPEATATVPVGSSLSWSELLEQLAADRKTLADNATLTIDFGTADGEAEPGTFTFGEGDVTLGSLIVRGSNGGTIQKTGSGTVTVSTSATINTAVAIEGQIQLNGLTIADGAELAITNYAVLGTPVSGAGALKITGATLSDYLDAKIVSDSWTGTVVLADIDDSHLDLAKVVNADSSLTIEGTVKAYIFNCAMRQLTLNGAFYGNNGTTDSTIKQCAVIGSLTGDGTIYGHCVESATACAYVDLVFTSAAGFTGTIDLSGATSAGTTVCFGEATSSLGQIVFTTGADAIVPTGKTWTAVNGIYVHAGGTIRGNGTLAIPEGKAFRYASSNTSIFGGTITGVDANKNEEIEAEEYGNLVMELANVGGHLTLSGDAHFATVDLNRSAGTGEEGLTLECEMKVYKHLTYSNNFYLISTARSFGKVVVKSGATVVQPNTNAGGFKCAFDFEAGAIIDATAVPFMTDLRFASAGTFKLPDEGAVIVKVPNLNNQIFIKVSGTVESDHTGSLDERFTIKFVEGNEELKDTLDDRDGYVVEGRAYGDVSYGIQSMSVRQTSSLSEAALQEIAGIVYQATYKEGANLKDVTSVTNPEYADCFTKFSLTSAVNSVTLYATFGIGSVTILPRTVNEVNEVNDEPVLQVAVAVKVTNGGFGNGEEFASTAYLRDGTVIHLSTDGGTNWVEARPLSMDDLVVAGLATEQTKADVYAGKSGVYWYWAGNLPAIQEGTTSYDVKAVNEPAQ